MKEETVRNSAVELLRIFFMLAIVGHHYILHGNVTVPENLAVNRFIADFFLLAGTWAVYGFVLISGYYMSFSSFTLRKAVKLLSSVYFYSFLFLLLFAVFAPANLGGKWQALLLPVLDLRAYWFITYYFFLMMLSPFLNIVIRDVSLPAYRYLLGLLLFFSCVVPYVNVNNVFMHFITLYFTAGYLRRAEFHCVSAGNCWGVAVILLLLMFLLPGDSAVFGIKKICFSVKNLLLMSFPAFLLLGALSVKKFSNPIVNLLAGAAFGVYLIHDNILVRHWLWNPCLQVCKRGNESSLWIHLLLCIFSIYALGAVIEFLRQRLIEKNLSAAMDALIGKL